MNSKYISSSKICACKNDSISQKIIAKNTEKKKVTRYL